MNNRYQITGIEGEFEPGSNHGVLRNLVGIQSVQDMEDLELSLLAQLYQEILIDQFPDRALTVNDLKTWHRLWLGNVYAWAGQERSVNMGKGGFQFAAAAQIPPVARGLRTQIPTPMDTHWGAHKKRADRGNRGHPCRVRSHPSHARGQWAPVPLAG